MTRKYKVIYDDKHQYYKTTPDINIPEQIKKDITIENWCWDYDIKYCGISHSMILDIPYLESYPSLYELIGLYHLCGEGALNSFSEYLDSIIKIYEKPGYETRLAMKIIEELSEYTLSELKEAVPELMI